MLVPTDARFQAKSADGIHSRNFLAELPACGLLRSKLLQRASDDCCDQSGKDVCGSSSLQSADSASYDVSTTPSNSVVSSFARTTMFTSTGTSLTSSEVHSEDSSSGCASELEGQSMPCHSPEKRTSNKPSSSDAKSLAMTQYNQFSNGGSDFGSHHHSQLRNALLNSGRANSNPTIRPIPLSDQSHSYDPVTLAKPCDDSAVLYTEESKRQAVFARVELAQSTSNEYNLSQSTVSPPQPLARSLSRPPSASNILRRASCEDLAGSTQIKSASQPQSPDFRPLHNAVPVSPCRLPMKKRKVDWNQLEYSSTDSNSTPIAATSASQPCVSVKRSPSSSQPRPQPVNFSNNQNPLVINCPLASSAHTATGIAVPKGRSPSSPGDSRSTQLTSASQEDMTSALRDTVPPIQRLLLPTSTRSKLVEDKGPHQSKLSLLARTLTSVSDLSRTPLHGPSSVQNGTYLRPHQLNASDPCIHPSEKLLATSDRFLSKVVAAPLAPRLHCGPGRLTNRWPIHVAAGCSKSASFASASSTSVATTGSSAPKNLSSTDQSMSQATSQVKLPIVSNSSKLPIRAPILLPVSTIESSNHSTSPGGLDSAQVLMMLSPPDKAGHSDPRGALNRSSNTGISPFTSCSASSFPLLLIAASSSAGAEALAAAAAMATGAPPSSLIPVPVQLTPYVPDMSQQSLTGDSFSVNGPRFMISLCNAPASNQSGARTQDPTTNGAKPTTVLPSIHSVSGTPVPLSHTAAMAHSNA